MTWWRAYTAAPLSAHTENDARVGDVVVITGTSREMLVVDAPVEGGGVAVALRLRSGQVVEGVFRAARLRLVRRGRPD